MSALVGWFTAQGLKIVTGYFKKKKFNIVKFINRLDDLIKKSDPRIYIYVSNKNINFNNLHKNIETIYDEKITEGFKVEYKGKIYDYSI